MLSVPIRSRGIRRISDSGMQMGGFEGKGTNRTLQELEKRVITQWLPTSGYTYAEIPDIEVYLHADPEDAVYEYWLPVR